jgi:putative sterol carrier protein
MLLLTDIEKNKRNKNAGAENVRKSQLYISNSKDNYKLYIRNSKDNYKLQKQNS